MDKTGYALLFQEAIRRALQQAGLSATLSEPVVEFHGRPNPKRRVKVDEALDFLWLSADRFYRIVDVAAFSGEDNPPVIFVRPAGFEPSTYEDTWEPSGLGPFKVIGPATRGLRG
jgi:hypothetical protein